MNAFRLAFAAALAASSAPARGQEAPAASAPIVVRIYHTNDIHGWIMPRPDKLQAGRPLGGAAALKSLLDRDSSPKLVLDAGDWWQGTPVGALTKGGAVAEVLDAVGYDAVEVGNHEFDAGVDALRSLIGRMSMPVLAANIYGPDGKRVPWTRPHVIKEVAGVKFGIFGLLTTHVTELEFARNIAGLTFRREVDEARDQVKELRKEGADVIIAVTHVGYESPNLPKFEGDQTIAREVEGIDLIVGGHTHTSLTRAWRDPEHGTLVVQAGLYLTKVGRATLKIDPTTRHVAASSDELLELWPDRVGEDPAVKAIVAARVAEADKAFQTVVATATAGLERGLADRESRLGSWMADCYKDATGADVAVLNGGGDTGGGTYNGGIRADIPAGPVTLGNFISVMPFDNALVRVKMKGALLRSILDYGTGAVYMIQISGATVGYRRSKPRGERLGPVVIGGAPLDDAKTYVVGTTDFLSEGNDGYGDFKKADSQEPTGVKARDALRACAEKQKTISPPPSGRLKDLGS